MKTIWNRIITEPAITLAVIFAVTSVAVDSSWHLYAAAGVTALLRFFVSPAQGK